MSEPRAIATPAVRGNPARYISWPIHHPDRAEVLFTEAPAFVAAVRTARHEEDA